MTDSSDASSVNSQILQLQEENKRLKQRVVYVSLGPFLFFKVFNIKVSDIYCFVL